jgi:hypothetical protein
MSNNWKYILVLIAFMVLCTSQAKADSPIVLTFEGIPDETAIGNYYNGGAGGSLGIGFGPDALAIVSELSGGTGNFSNQPSGDTIAFFLTGPGDVMDVAAGFTTGFSFFYTSTSNPGSVSVWSGLDGTGTELATLDLAALGTCDPAPNFCNWSMQGVSFSGTAKSAIFSGVADEIGFDNITIGSATAGGGPTVPEPSSFLLLFAGLAGLSWFAIRRQLA